MGYKVLFTGEGVKEKPAAKGAEAGKTAQGAQQAPQSVPLPAFQWAREALAKAKAQAGKEKAKAQVAMERANRKIKEEEIRRLKQKLDASIGEAAKWRAAAQLAQGQGLHPPERPPHHAGPCPDSIGSLCHPPEAPPR